MMADACLVYVSHYVRMGLSMRLAKQKLKIGRVTAAIFVIPYSVFRELSVEVAYTNTYRTYTECQTRK